MLQLQSTLFVCRRGTGKGTVCDAGAARRVEEGGAIQLQVPRSLAVARRCCLPPHMVRMSPKGGVLSNCSQVIMLFTLPCISRKKPARPLLLRCLCPLHV